MKALVAGLAIALLAPSAAQAATITIQDNGDTSTLFVGAAAGETFNLTITTEPGKITLLDTTVTWTFPTPPCSNGDEPGEIVCTNPELADWQADLSLNADSFVHNGSLPGTVGGDDGADQLTGGAAGEKFDGGSGHDTILGGPGPDMIQFPGAGPDADTIDLGDGTDLMNPQGSGGTATLGPGNDIALHVPVAESFSPIEGGPGVDKVVSVPVMGETAGLSANLETGVISLAPPFPQVLTTYTGFEDIDTEGGGDTVTGTAGPNVIRTTVDPLLTVNLPNVTVGSGNDVVDPKAGTDRVLTYEGNDQVTSVDGYADDIHCGEGQDTVTADQLDTLADCETPTIQRVTPAGADVTPAACQVSKAASKAKRKGFLRGYSITLSCDEDVTLDGELLVAAKRKRGKVVLARAGDVILAEGSAQLTAGQAATLKLKPSKRLAKALAAKFTARVVLDARDGVGNRTTLNRTVKVSTPKRKKRKRR